MSVISVGTWLLEFVVERGGRKPDGRPLYAYRLSSNEVEHLRQLLACITLDHVWLRERDRETVARGFCLYAAEWWRRNHDGGPWKWKGITDALGWPELTHARRRELVTRGLAWWRRPIIQTHDANEYLATLACEGGLPLQLIERESAALGRFFRALLREFGKYRKQTPDDDILRLIRPIKHYLPATLQQPEVLKLSTELVDAVWKLRKKVAGVPNPVERLDLVEPEWRRSLPISLGSEQADNLIRSLLVQSGRIADDSAAAPKLERWFSRETLDGAWKARATLTLPRKLSGAQLGRLFSCDLPDASRLLLRLEVGGESRIVAVLSRMAGESGIDYRMEVLDRPSLHLVGELALAAVELVLLAGPQQLGRWVPVGGAALDDEEPWILAPAEEEEMGSGYVRELEYLAQGGGNYRIPAVYVALPIGASFAEDSKAVDIAVSLHGRQLISAECELVVTLEGGETYRIRPNDPTAYDVPLNLIGRRLFEYEESMPIYAGLPQIFAESGDGPIRIPLDQVRWRPAGQHYWLRPSKEPCIGAGEIAASVEGGIRFRQRIVVLPSTAAVGLVPAAHDGVGNIELRGFGRIRVWTDTPEAALDPRPLDGGLIVRCRSKLAGPDSLKLRIEWDDGAKAALVVPFPVTGAHFVGADGRAICTNSVLSVDELFGVRATAVSSTPEGFAVSAALRDGGPQGALRQLHVEQSLERLAGGYRYQLPLVHLLPALRALFAAATSVDSEIELSISPNAAAERIFLRQYAHEMKWEVERKTLTADPPAKGVLHAQAWSIAQPIPSRDLDPVPGVPYSWYYSDLDPRMGPWLAVVWRDNHVCCRPTIIPGMHPPSAEYVDEHSEAPVTSLAQAVRLRNKELRQAAISSYLSQLSVDATAGDWQLPKYYVRELWRLPPTTFDVLTTMVEQPQTLAMFLLIAGDDFDAVWALQENLSFRWQYIPPAAWEAAGRNWLASMLAALPEALQAVIGAELRRKLAALFVRIEDAEPALSTTKMWVHHRLCDEHAEWEQAVRLPAAQVLAIAEARLDEALSGLVRRASDRRYPHGPTRDDWRERLPIKVPERFFRTIADGNGYRKPVLDAPVAAAAMAVAGYYPSQSDRVLLSNLRRFDEEWFTEAFHLISGCLTMLRQSEEPAHEYQ